MTYTKAMLARPTTFVLGAGASYDLNLPTGDGLQNKITELLRPDSQARKLANDRLWDALQPQFEAINWGSRAVALTVAASKIRQGMPVAASIDNYLHTHQHDADIVLLGKLAIALAILEAEAMSHFRPSELVSPLITKGYRESWYGSFIRMLTMGTLSDDPRALFGNAKFVVFNYDRCLELAFLYTLRSYYGLSEVDAADVLGSVEIIHPYGSLGPLTGNGHVAFGANTVDLNAIAGKIQTFTESADSHTIVRARAAISEADVLVFLGFGFLPQNMNLLDPGEERKATRIHATTLGFSNTDKIVLKERLRRFVRPPSKLDLGDIQHIAVNSSRSGFIDVDNGACVDLISNHRVRLTAG